MGKPSRRSNRVTRRQRQQDQAAVQAAMAQAAAIIQAQITEEQRRAHAIIEERRRNAERARAMGAILYNVFEPLGDHEHLDAEMDGLQQAVDGNARHRKIFGEIVDRVANFYWNHRVSLRHWAEKVLIETFVKFVNSSVLFFVRIVEPVCARRRVLICCARRDRKRHKRR